MYMWVLAFTLPATRRLHRPFPGQISSAPVLSLFPVLRLPLSFLVLLIRSLRVLGSGLLLAQVRLHRRQIFRPFHQAFIKVTSFRVLFSWFSVFVITKK